jgi:hypothetical protein
LDRGEKKGKSQRAVQKCVWGKIQW